MMISIQFEESRRGYPVPPDCPVWHPKGEQRIPLVHMRTQHIKNCMSYLLRIGMPEMNACRLYHYNMQHPGPNHTGVLSACLLRDSVRRLKYMDLWYGRFVEELERRITDGESVGAYPVRIPTEGSRNKTIRDRVVSIANCVRHLLPAPEGAARDSRQ